MARRARRARTALARQEKRVPANLTPPNTARGAWTTFGGLEGVPEDWFQRDIKVDREKALSNWAVFSCFTLIAGDLGKMRIKLLEQNPTNAIWSETTSTSFSPVLRKPNHYQTRQKMIESWAFSKLREGNTYALKDRDRRGVVTALHVLDPTRCRPLVASNGEVFYELQADDLAQIPNVDGMVYVPASEIIHDRMWCLFHPLVGLSPLFACGLAATHGLSVLHNTTTFFRNMSRPSGVLTAPGEIGDDLAKRMKRDWESNYKHGHSGRVAVLGDGLKYEPMASNAKDSQLVEQSELSARMICATLHVPPWKIGLGEMPAFENAGLQNQGYYSDCIQPLAEAIEATLDEGLGLDQVEGKTYGTELDTKALLRMDEKAKTFVMSEQVKSAIASPNEARAEFDRKPVDGGATPYLQQQNYSLAALEKRDAMEDPFATEPKPADPLPPADPEDAAKEIVGDFFRAAMLRFAEA